ncbi:MAG: DUF5011 domain-containing protein [Candidatus Gracilibacteria bacterium]|nr:DUF5011 domain-containing protein [Candidatus Gracilibacteria bacterium]
MKSKDTIIALGTAATLGLSGCGGGNNTTKISENNDTTPKDPVVLVDAAMECTITQVGDALLHEATVNVKCTDDDGIKNTPDFPATITLGNGEVVELSFDNDTKSFDSNTTFTNITEDSNTTATLEVSSINGENGEVDTTSTEINIVTSAIPDPEILDTTTPVLSLGDNTFTSTVGTAITLETVTATDNVDGSVTVVQSGDTVDSNTVGTYNVVYTATDTAGNESTIIHTYVVEAAPVLDTTAPVLSLGDNTFTSTVGTAITLKTVTATDNVDGSVTVVQSGDTVDSNTVGTYNVVYTATDTAGNESTIIHTYVVEAAPVLDTTAPVLSFMR